jgi:hypothetical protein
MSGAAGLMGSGGGGSGVGSAMSGLTGGGLGGATGALGSAGQLGGVAQAVGMANQFTTPHSQTSIAQADYDKARAACLSGRGYSVQ